MAADIENILLTLVAPVLVPTAAVDLNDNKNQNVIILQISIRNNIK